MGKITVIIDTELETEFRVAIAKKGGKHGDLRISIEEAIYSWLFERCLNEFKRYCRPILWEKSQELRIFDDCIKSIRNNIADINIHKKYKSDINVSPEEIKKSVDELRKSLADLGKILPEDFKENHLKDFKDSIEEIIKKALKNTSL